VHQVPTRLPPSFFQHRDKSRKEAKMRRLIAILLPIVALAMSPAMAQTMQVSPNGARASASGPEANFTGRVTVTPLFGANEHSNASAGQVEFMPGARSNWHTHPAGQTLIVTSGSGWVQQEGGEKIEIKPGDVIWTPPGVKHWHGAAATSSLTHIAVTPMASGKNVDWLEPVSDAQYR
jgi:quercetin dioxygenase-like cupin family protein